MSNIGNQEIGQWFLGGTEIGEAYLGSTLIFSSTAQEYTLESAGITFSVAPSGIVTLAITNGSFTMTQFANGHDFGTVSADTVRTNNVTFSDGTTTLMATLEATQLATTVPTVVTRTPTQVRTTSVRLQGTITSNGNLPITESGFYILAGSGYSSSNVASNGTRVLNSVLDIIGDFDEVTSNLTQNTLYSFVAFARNDAGIAYSPVRTFTTDQAAAVAGYLTTFTGTATGGTVTSTVTVSTGEWTGAANIVFNAQGTPISADCAADQATCAITRSSNVRDTYTGGTRTDEQTCSITSPGSGNPRCSNPDNPLGAVIDNVVTGVTYTVDRVEVEMRSVANNAEDRRVEFEVGNIIVDSCSVNADGNSASVNTNVGTAIVTNIGQISANNTGSTRTVNLEFSVTINQGDIDETQFIVESYPLTFTGLTTMCEQPPVPLQAPTFNANTARVTAVGIDSNVSDGADFGGVTSAYQVTAPTGTGGIVMTGTTGNGAGSFTAPTGRGRRHSFTITNSVGTVTYEFTVRSGV